MIEQLARLNGGHPVPTFDLVPAGDRAPVVGEIRYLVPLIPMPGEPLASLMPLHAIRIVWTGHQWEIVP